MFQVQFRTARVTESAIRQEPAPREAVDRATLYNTAQLTTTHEHSSCRKVSYLTSRRLDRFQGGKETFSLGGFPTIEKWRSTRQRLHQMKSV